MMLKSKILLVLCLLQIGAFAQGDSILSLKYSINRCKTGICINISKENVSKRDTLITYGRQGGSKIEYDSVYANQITDDSLIDPILIRDYLIRQKIEVSNAVFPSCILLYPGEKYKYKVILKGISKIKAKYFVERYQITTAENLNYIKKIKHPADAGKFLNKERAVQVLIKL